MGNRAAVEAAEAVCACAAALLAAVKGGTDSAGVVGHTGFTGPADAARLAGRAADDPLRREADGWLDTLALTARLNAQVAAVAVHAAAGYAGTAQALASPDSSDRAQEMAVVAEVACVLTVSERTAGALLAESQALTTALPLTLSALTEGSLSWQHARVMVDETTNLDASAAQALEAHFLDPEAENPNRGCPAGELVPSRFRHKARIWRERHHPVSIEKRHTRSVADRRLEYRPDRDGMAWLSAYLPADQAAGIWNRTTAAARALQGQDEDRTMTQMRADIAATLLLCGDADGSAAGRVPSPRAQVLLTVPIMSLLGATDEPAMLDGFGPIPVTMARRLIADGATSFHRVLIDPRDGAPLEIGRTSYPVTKAQRQWLRMRDGKCPFPGCHNQSLDNEADHLLAWAHGGTTGITNLAQPCPKHHKLRHTGGWNPGPATKDEPPGWISPTGRRYASEQPDWEPPQLPEVVRQILQGPPNERESLVRPGDDKRRRELRQPGEPKRSRAGSKEPRAKETKRKEANRRDHCWMKADRDRNVGPDRGVEPVALDPGPDPDLPRPPDPDPDWDRPNLPHPHLLTEVHMNRGTHEYPVL